MPKGDTTQIRNYVSRQTSRTFGPSKGLDGQRFSSTTIKEKTGRITSFDKAMFEELFREVSVKLSIENRITASQLEILIERELRNRGLNLDFEFAVYDKSLSVDKEKPLLLVQGSTLQQGICTPYPCSETKKENLIMS